MMMVMIMIYDQAHSRDESLLERTWKLHAGSGEGVADEQVLAAPGLRDAAEKATCRCHHREGRRDEG